MAMGDNSMDDKSARVHESRMSALTLMAFLSLVAATAAKLAHAGDFFAGFSVGIMLVCASTAAFLYWRDARRGRGPAG